MIKYNIQPDNGLLQWGKKVFGSIQTLMHANGSTSKY